MSADEQSPRRRRRWGTAIGIAAVLVLGVVAWRLLASREPPARPAAGPVTVVAATAAATDLDVNLTAIGTVTPVATVTIASQVTGRVTAVHYREGQTVRAGDLLVEIDPRPFEAQVLQAEGTLERDRQILAQAKMDLQRFRAAWAKNAIAKQQLDDQEKIVLQAEGTVKLDRGVLDFNRVQLSYTRIEAPVAGRVGLRLVDPGNLVNAGTITPLLVITQLQPITVVFTLSEDRVGQVWRKVRAGHELVVFALDRDSKKTLAQGKLLTLDNQIDTTTGTVRLRAEFPNTHDELFPNQFVNTKLLVEILHDATTVPSAAVQHAADKSFVYVLRDGRAHVQAVTPGVTQRGLTQVGGISVGTVVANSSFDKLHDDAPVAITRSQQPPAGSPVSAAP
jgi:multidrug efflux system membrane fusion protein